MSQPDKQFLADGKQFFAKHDIKDFKEKLLIVEKAVNEFNSMNKSESLEIASKCRRCPGFLSHFIGKNFEKLEPHLHKALIPTNK